MAANDDEPRAAGPGGGRPGGGRSYAVAGNLALAEDAGAIEAVLLCPLRFQGQWQDAETGLVYNRFRYFDALTAAYVSRDLIGLSGGYASWGYVSNPNSWIDPLGLSDERGLWDPSKQPRSIYEGGPFGTKFFEDKSVPRRFWTKDVAGHGGSAWKVYEMDKAGNLNWKTDADIFGDYMLSKHKSDTGKFISRKTLRRCC